MNGESAALAVGGCAVRLVGLYHSQRGAHTFFLRAGEVARWGGYVINLIHYEDAASLCVAVRPKSYIGVICYRCFASQGFGSSPECPTP